MASFKLALLLATSLLPAACASHGMPIMTDPQDVFDYGKRGNWRVRAFVGETVHEGRISFVGSDRVRIFDQEVMIAEIDSVHRSVEVDQGGKVAGGVMGGLIGGGVGLLGVQFASHGPGSGCDGSCQVQIMLPITLLGSVIGTLIGAGVGPAERRWVSAWKRP